MTNSKKIQLISDILHNVYDSNTWSDEYGHWVSVDNIREIVDCNCGCDTNIHLAHEIECKSVKYEKHAIV